MSFLLHANARLYLHDFCHNFTFSFISLVLNFKIQILSCHIITYFIFLDSLMALLNPTSHREAMSFLIHSSDILFPCMISTTTLLSPSFLFP